MSSGAFERSAQDLRREFDESFRRAVDVAPAATEDLLAIRAGDGSFALRLVDVRRIMPCPRLVRVPSLTPHLMGVAAVRGALVGVYGLAGLLGAASQSNSEWLCLSRNDSVAFAFDELQGYARVDFKGMGEDGAEGTSGRGRIVRIADTRRVLINLPVLLQTIVNRAGTPDQNGG